MNLVQMAYEDLMDSRVPSYRIPQKRFYPRCLMDFYSITFILESGPTDEQFEYVIRRLIRWMTYLGKYERKRALRPRYAQDAIEMQALLDLVLQVFAARNGGIWGPGFMRPTDEEA
jgi:hypothetical protein